MHSESLGMRVFFRVVKCVTVEQRLLWETHTLFRVSLRGKHNGHSAIIDWVFRLTLTEGMHHWLRQVIWDRRVLFTHEGLVAEWVPWCITPVDWLDLFINVKHGFEKVLVRIVENLAGFFCLPRLCIFVPWGWRGFSQFESHRLLRLTYYYFGFDITLRAFQSARNS